MTTKALRLPATLAALALLFAGGGPAGCLKTPTPDEEYAQPDAGSGAVGGSSDTGGSTTGGRGGSGDGGDTAAAGESGAGGAGGAELPLIDCGPAPISGESFSKAALRQAAAACAAWHSCRFENAALVLASRVSEHADTRSESSLAAARDAFREAMEIWSENELFQFGPLASAAESAGKDVHQGQGLRDLIYSWRSVARCRVEEQVAGQGYLDGMESVLISGRGLYAIEYLLFYPGSDTACVPASPTGQAWSSLGAAELEDRKLAYAVAAADDVLAQIQKLRSIWDPGGDNFVETFVSAPSSAYPTEQEAMNALGFALLYVERELKDYKLGMRIGIIEGDPVPEVPFAAFTEGYEELPTENVRRNLRGFRALFQGCGPDGEGLGFDDWLEASGHGELAADIVSAWQDAQNAADAFPPLESASNQEIGELYEALRVLANLLKTEMFGPASPLGLKLPATVGSDTD